MRKSIISSANFFFILALSTFLLFSCKKDQQVPTENNSSSPNSIDKNNAVYKYIKSLGFRENEIKDIGNEFLVDGDLLFAKNANADSLIPRGGRTQQYGLANYVDYNLQPNITVRIDPSMNAYVNEINGAIALWNNVINSRVRFTITTAANQNILITNFNLGAGYCGAAFFPMNGQPGATVKININEIAGNVFLQRQRTIAHELGHAIGFKHTNWQALGEPQIGTHPDNNAFFDAMHILGTPTGADPNSLMNGNECGTGATALSNFDILALQFLYPANPRAAGTVPVFRYYGRSTNGDHFYTTNYNELQSGSNNNYIFEGIGFFAFPNQVDGSVPVFRYYKVAPADHFYTTNPNEVPPSQWGYNQPEGVAFYAYPSAINGSIPVYRYYNPAPGPDDHFYTLNQSEITFMPGYNSEGIGWFAY